MSEETDVVKAVRGWVEKRGYPLEMRVARAFEIAGGAVAQSYFYSRNKQPLRELDVVAWHHADIPQLRGAVDVDVVCVAECKDAPSAPHSHSSTWVVFTHRWESNGRRIPLHLLEVTVAAENGLLGIEQEATPPALLAFGERIGHNVVAALPHEVPKDGKAPKEAKSDDGYELAYATTLKAADAGFAFVDQEVSAGARLCRVVLPIVVIGTPLVETWLDDAGHFRIEERDRMSTMVKMRDRFDAERAVLVHIVRESALDSFISDVQGIVKHLIDHGTALSAAVMSR